jgi:hypothetical protein
VEFIVQKYWRNRFSGAPRPSKAASRLSETTGMTRKKASSVSRMQGRLFVVRCLKPRPASHASKESGSSYSKLSTTCYRKAADENTQNLSRSKLNMPSHFPHCGCRQCGTMTHDSAIRETKKKNSPITPVRNVFTQSRRRSSMISGKQDRPPKLPLRRAIPS